MSNKPVSIIAFDYEVNIPFEVGMSLIEVMPLMFPRVKELQYSEDGWAHIDCHEIKLNVANLRFKPCFMAKFQRVSDTLIEWPRYAPTPVGDCNLMLYGEGFPHPTKAGVTCLKINSELFMAIPAIFGATFITPAHTKIMKDHLDKFVASLEEKGLNVTSI